MGRSSLRVPQHGVVRWLESFPLGGLFLACEDLQGMEVQRYSLGKGMLAGNPSMQDVCKCYLKDVP